MKSAGEFYDEVVWSTDAAAIASIKARDLAMWKQGMTDAADLAEGDDTFVYCGEIVAKRDNAKSV